MFGLKLFRLDGSHGLPNHPGGCLPRLFLLLTASRFTLHGHLTKFGCGPQDNRNQLCRYVGSHLAVLIQKHFFEALYGNFVRGSPRVRTR